MTDQDDETPEERGPCPCGHEHCECEVNWLLGQLEGKNDLIDLLERKELAAERLEQRKPWVFLVWFFLAMGCAGLGFFYPASYPASPIAFVFGLAMARMMDW